MKTITESHVGTLKVNMKHMSKWKVDQDNIKAYNHIMQNKGNVQTLDTRSYEDHLNHFGIFYTKRVNETIGFKEWMDLRESTEDEIARIAKKHGVPTDSIKKQLQYGIKVEHEHASNDKEAAKIALDHIAEIPNYYDKLSKMEQGKCD